jgi:RNA polymerase sigma factor (sigma-70 family)
MTKSKTETETNNMNLNMSNEELAVLIKAGETSHYSQLWTQCERFFRHKAYSYYFRNKDRTDSAGQTADDFYNSCFLALVKAVESYNPESGYTLLTYCKYPMLNEFRSLMGTRSSRRDPLNDYNNLSLDKTVSDEEGSEIYSELVEDPESLTPFEEMTDRQYTLKLRTDLEAALDTLTEREADIIRSHYFKGIPVEQIAVKYGVTRQVGNVIKANALINLRRCAEIKRYHDDIISREAYCHIGLNRWKVSGVSSVERAVEMAEWVTELIAELDDTEYMILRAHYEEGMSIHHIARIFRLSAGYVKDLCKSMSKRFKQEHKAS